MSKSKKAKKYVIPTFLILIMAVSALAAYNVYSNGNGAKADPDVNVGVAFCGNTTAEAKLLIDRVKTYTNLFIMDTAGNALSRNQSAVEEICDYAVSQNLKVIINIGTIYFNASWFWHSVSIDTIKQQWTQRWGDKFLGIYYSDEPGGIQLDGDWSDWFNTYNASLAEINHPTAQMLNDIFNKMQAAKINGTKPQNYDEEAKFFVQNVVEDDPGRAALKKAEIHTFTSDYCLYWFDYLGGYDTLFTELGWNCSVTQQIDLVKGAARLQNKDWGAIITWKYGSAPYLDTGDQIYNQMETAYQAGAKYIIIFNYPSLAGNNYGVMNDEHFIALERFWKDINDHKLSDLSQPEAVLVLPSNYGWGMRNPTDNIWGFWAADDKSQVIGVTMSKLLTQYGVGLDIVFEDPAYPIANVNYQHVYYWNSTTQQL